MISPAVDAKKMGCHQKTAGTVVSPRDHGFKNQAAEEQMVTRSGKRLHNELERSTMLLMGESTINDNFQ